MKKTIIINLFLLILIFNLNANSNEKDTNALKKIRIFQTVGYSLFSPGFIFLAGSFIALEYTNQIYYNYQDVKSFSIKSNDTITNYVQNDKNDILLVQNIITSFAFSLSSSLILASTIFLIYSEILERKYPDTDNTKLLTMNKKLLNLGILFIANGSFFTLMGLACIIRYPFIFTRSLSDFVCLKNLLFPTNMAL